MGPSDEDVGVLLLCVRYKRSRGYARRRTGYARPPGLVVPRVSVAKAPGLRKPRGVWRCWSVGIAGNDAAYKRPGYPGGYNRMQLLPGESRSGLRQPHKEAMRLRVLRAAPGPVVAGRLGLAESVAVAVAVMVAVAVVVVSPRLSSALMPTPTPTLTP